MRQQDYLLYKPLIKAFKKTFKKIFNKPPVKVFKKIFKKTFNRDLNIENKFLMI